MAEVCAGAGELEARCRGRRTRLLDGAFAAVGPGDLERIRAARADADVVAVAVWAEGEPAGDRRAALVAAVDGVDLVCVAPRAEVAALRARLAAPPAAPPPPRITSRHKDRVVVARDGVFVKEFTSRRARDAELRRLWKLKAIGIAVPDVLECPGTSIVTAPLPGEPLDELIARDWASMPRNERNRLIARVASLCRTLRDAGYDWPDLVTYHVFVAPDGLAVLDPARLRRGRLDLSPLYWSADEPTVSRADRLRFWRAYAGDARPPRPRRIGHRGRFRPYRWVHQRVARRACPPWAAFVNAVGGPWRDADGIAADMTVKRTLADRVNGELGDLVVKVVPAEQARQEWENHRLMLAAGFRVPQPAVGGVLKDGRGLFATVRLRGMLPLDQAWGTVAPRRMVRDVADLARRLHAGGLVHRDLYLNHLYVRPGGSELTLLDLGRLTKTTARRRRVKDLAALLMSAAPLCSRTDLLRGLRRYGGDRRLARAVIRKAARMARHVPRRVRDGTHSVAKPATPCTSA